MKPTTAPNCFSSSALVTPLLLCEIVEQDPVLLEDPVVVDDRLVDHVVQFAEAPPPVFQLDFLVLEKPQLLAEAAELETETVPAPLDFVEEAADELTGCPGGKTRGGKWGGGGRGGPCGSRRG